MNSQLSTLNSQLVVDYILDGIEAELALERELGVRSIEIDRALLNPPSPAISQSHNPTISQSHNPTIPQSHNPTISQSPTPSPAISQSHNPAISKFHNPTISQSPSPAISQSHNLTISQSPSPAISQSSYDFVFLHDRALSGAGAEMIAKITAAMGRTAETAPVIFGPPRPTAKLYVVLGDRALKKWFPAVRARPGMWITGSEGEEALVTYSPNYFLRFGEVTPAVKKIKTDMWNSLKGVLQRLALQQG